MYISELFRKNNLLFSSSRGNLEKKTKLIKKKLDFVLIYLFIYDGVKNPYKCETEVALDPFVTCISYIILGNIRRAEHNFMLCK